MRVRHVRLASILLAAFGGAFAAARGALGGEGDPHAAFFVAFEKGDGKAAMAALSADVRDASPYDAQTAALAPYERDEPIYSALLERFEKDVPVSDAARREEILHAAVASIAWREGDFERARRRFLLALGRNPFDRLAHLAMSRCYAALEAEAMRTAGDRPVGEVLIEKVGFGSSDLHVQLAEEIVEKRFPAGLEAVTASFLFDAGKVSDFETTRAKASGNALLQRPRAAAPDKGHFQVVLVAADRARLDEAWFESVRTLYQDGMDGTGKPVRTPTYETKFRVSVELLSPEAATRVLVYDGEGKRVHEAPAVPPPPAK